jgi:hypothetical protein|tara:strand:+ start:1286 stop:2803 length:1518 start_codon:yes stop_codon:yes gene_type:complete
MNLSDLNLDVNSYTDERLRKSFALNENYTKEDVVVATSKLSNAVSETLTQDDEIKFNEFIRAAEDRLLKNKLVEKNNLGDQFSYLETSELLPTDRQLTLLPGQQKDSVSQQIISNQKNTNTLSQSLPVSKNQQGKTNDELATTEQEFVIPLPEPPSLPQGITPYKPETVVTRIVSIDSQYRQNIATLTPDGRVGTDGAPDSNSLNFNTNFTVDLPEALTNVVSIKLYSVQIPTTWYTFDHHLGNTSYKHNTDTLSFIDVGNYDISGVCDALNSSGLIGTTFAPQSNIITLGGVEANYINSYTSDMSNSFINQNLFWNLGFRKKINEDGDISFNAASSGDVPADVYGPRYFVLNLDDYNQNSQSKGLLSVTDQYNPINAIQSKRTDGKSETRLTKAQLYSQTSKLGYDDLSGNNLVASNRYNNLRNNAGSRSNNAFALIPLRDVISLRAKNEPLVEFGRILEENVRTYSGPVDIERLKIQLLDDKGNLVNLHDNDWCFSLVVEQLV